MASYKTAWDLEPVVKYDHFDPDLTVDGDSHNNLTFGINYFFNDWTRLQVNYVMTQEENPIMNDMLMFQAQVKF